MDLFHEGNIHFIDEDYDLAIKVRFLVMTFFAIYFKFWFVF
jgi:hypothetical protein